MRKDGVGGDRARGRLEWSADVRARAGLVRRDGDGMKSGRTRRRMGNGGLVTAGHQKMRPATPLVQGRVIEGPGELARLGQAERDAYEAWQDVRDPATKPAIEGFRELGLAAYAAALREWEEGCDRARRLWVGARVRHQEAKDRAMGQVRDEGFAGYVVDEDGEYLT